MQGRWLISFDRDVKHISTIHVFHCESSVHLINQLCDYLHITVIGCEMQRCKQFVCLSVCPLFQVLFAFLSSQVSQVVLNCMLEYVHEAVSVVLERTKAQDGIAALLNHFGHVNCAAAALKKHL